MTSAISSHIGKLLLLAVLSIASCQRDESGNADVDQIESPASTDNNEETVAGSPKPETTNFDGFLDYGAPIELQSTENPGALPEGVIITESRIEMPVFTTKPDKIEDAEQSGTGQSATRPESTLEGGEKPQPKAEGRSR
jgi:hypothetical protein